jgi:hypothetical protein
MRDLDVHFLALYMVDEALIGVFFQFIWRQLFTYRLRVVSDDHKYRVTSELQLTFADLDIGGLNQVEPGTHGQVASSERFEECNPRPKELVVRNVWVQTVQILPERDRVHVPRDLNLGKFAKLPALWIPLAH